MKAKKLSSWLRLMVRAGDLCSKHKKKKFITPYASCIEHLYTTVGCHPTRCLEFQKHKDGPDQYYEELLKLIKEHSLSHKVVAIGECGLGNVIKDMQEVTSFVC